MSDNADDKVRVFYLTHPETVQNLQEVATLVRSLIGTRRLFTYNALKAVAVLGTSGDIALAGWLLSELDQATIRRGLKTRPYMNTGWRVVVTMWSEFFT